MRLALLFAAVATAQAAGLTATPSVVTWTYVSGSHNYPSASIALVSSSGATAYSATANSENGWLLVNAAYISSSATLSAGAYLIPASPIDRLDSGSYQGTINLTDSSGNTAAITVNLTITGNNNTGGITVSPASLTFSSAFNGPPQTQNVNVTGPTAGLLQVRAASGASPTWLQAVVTGAAGTFTLVVSVAPANMPPGIYRETLLLSIGSVSASLPVTLSIQGQSSLTASVSLLAFDFTPGDAPQIKFINVSSSGVNLQFSASANVQTGNWLAVIGAGTTPGSVQVMLQPEGLAPGFYGGSILITPTQGAPLIIPVTLTVRPTPVISVSAPSISFSYRTGDALPPPITVNVTGGGSNAIFTFVVDNEWLAVTASRPVAPATLSIGLKPVTLAPGTYNATITVTGTGTAKGAAGIAVALTVLGPGQASIALSKVTNAAGYQEGGIAPGEMVTLFGTGMAADGIANLVLDTDGKVATKLGGVQVLFNGIAAPIVYTSPTQIAAVARYEIQGRAQAAVQVTYNGSPSNQVQLPVVTTAPGIFTADASGAGLAAATTAPAGGVITLYLTGEGQTSPAGVTGSVTMVSPAPPLTPGPLLPVSVLLGGQPADYTFAGEAPGVVSGVMQLNVKVPDGMASGTYQVQVSIGGRASQPGVSVKVQ